MPTSLPLPDGDLPLGPEPSRSSRSFHSNGRAVRPARARLPGGRRRGIIGAGTRFGGRQERSPVATITEARTEWTVADILRKFGPIPVRRIRQDPAPGTATEEDLIAIHAHEDRLYELVDGVLVEKVMGWYEAYLALEIGGLLRNFVKPLRLGVVVGADGMYRINPGLVRLPDVSFLARDRIPGRHLPRQPICALIPNLAVEVLSASNTKKEMEGK